MREPCAPDAARFEPKNKGNNMQTNLTFNRWWRRLRHLKLINGKRAERLAQSRRAAHFFRSLCRSKRVESAEHIRGIQLRKKHDVNIARDTCLLPRERSASLIMDRPVVIKLSEFLLAHDNSYLNYACL